jgi:hypothetical protein
MRPLPRLSAALWIVLVGILASCSPLPGSSLLTRPTSSLSVPGLEGLGPLAEYRLDLALDPAERRLAGRQQVTIPNSSGVEWQEIVFRLYPNLPQYGGRIDIGPVWVDGQRTTSSLRTEETSLVIPLVRPLQPAASLTVSMTFQVTIPTRESGYVLFGYSQDIWSLPDAYPLLAVHDGERWHEDIAPPHGDAVFADVALYEVTLSLPPTLTLVTTGSVVSDTVHAGSQRVYRITGGPLREFALLASGEYRMAETAARGAIVRSYYLPEDEPAGKAALNSAAAALRAYADAFGLYPFPELTVVEAPLEFYGMEYPGLNLIGVTLYGDRRAQLEDRVVHEIAHQWWYAQVGNDQVNTPWLDEGLAEYSMATYYRQVYGEARANTLINQRWLIPYQTAVEDGYDTVVNQPSAAFGPEYEVIVYAKAALFFNALRQELGDQVYQAVLREYVDRYRWRIATPDDFLAAAESVSGRDLDTLYNRWILSKQ